MTMPEMPKPPLTQNDRGSYFKIGGSACQEYFQLFQRVITDARLDLKIHRQTLLKEFSETCNRFRTRLGEHSGERDRHSEFAHCYRRGVLQVNRDHYRQHFDVPYPGKNASRLALKI